MAASAWLLALCLVSAASEAIDSHRHEASQHNLHCHAQKGSSLLQRAQSIRKLVASVNESANLSTSQDLTLTAALLVNDQTSSHNAYEIRLRATIVPTLIAISVLWAVLCCSICLYTWQAHPRVNAQRNGDSLCAPRWQASFASRQQSYPSPLSRNSSPSSQRQQSRPSPPQQSRPDPMPDESSPESLPGSQRQSLAEQSTFGDEVDNANGFLHLCPDLVVPRGNECTLMLPSPSSLLIVDGGGQTTVDDPRSNPVFSVKTIAPQPTLGRDVHDMSEDDAKRIAAQFHRRLELWTNGNELVAFYSEVQAISSMHWTIHRADGQIFGSMTPVSELDSRWMVLLPQSRHLFISAGEKFGSHTSLFTARDDRNRLVAVAEPILGGEKCITRVGPDVDAGLVVIIFLSMMLLRTHAEAIPQN